MSFNNWKNHIHPEYEEKGSNIPEEMFYVTKQEGNKIVRVPYSDDYEGIYAEDFSIQSILDAGAGEDLLKPVGKLQASPLSQVEHIENTLDKVANKAESIKYEEEYNKSLEVTDKVEENKNIEE